MGSEHRVNEDVLRIMGFIGFVSILVGCSIAVFDARLWLRVDGNTYTNAMTYAMGAFTLQGMSFFFYKLLLQEGMDTKAQWTKSQRIRDRQIQSMNTQFQDAQLQQELRARQIALDRQIRLLDENPEAYMQMVGGLQNQALAAMPFQEPVEDFNPPPQHKSNSDKPISLGTDLTQNEEKEDGSKQKKKKEAQ